MDEIGETTKLAHRIVRRSFRAANAALRPRLSSEHQRRGRRRRSAPTDAENDCGCDDSTAAVLANSDQTSASSLSTLAILPVDLSNHRPRNLVLALRGHPVEADLPPPDILLLKSTLLI